MVRGGGSDGSDISCRKIDTESATLLDGLVEYSILPVMLKADVMLGNCEMEVNIL